MALRTITNPWNPETLADLQAMAGTELGVHYAKMDDGMKIQVDRIISAAGEYIAKRINHFPWAVHTIPDTVLPNGTNIIILPPEVRQVISVTETTTDGTRAITPITKVEYRNRWQRGYKQHPINKSPTSPVWFFDGMTDQNPPQQQWRREPTPTEDVTYSVMCRPYMTILGAAGDTLYTHLPANMAMASRSYVMEKISLLKKDWPAMQAHKAALEDEIAAAEVGDNPEGGWEVPRRVGLDENWVAEMDGP